jgi:chromosome segregation ATPase
MPEAKHATHPHDVKAKDLEPMTKAPPEKPEASRAAKRQQRDKSEKPQSLQQRLDDIRRRVEIASNSPVAPGKAEEFEDLWDELDDVGEGDTDNPADVALIQAAHNHLQHHAPRRASELDSLEAQLDRAAKQQRQPQAVPDTPEMAHVKARIADLHTSLANDPRALPGDKERAQELQHKVDGITAEKATAK